MQYVRMPPMILQPLVENAIKHGASQTERNGRIAIRASAADGRLTIQVNDNGPGFPGGFQLRTGGLGPFCHVGAILSQCLELLVEPIRLRVTELEDVDEAGAIGLLLPDIVA